MKLLELVLENFGPFAGRQVIPLRPSSAESPVVLIGGRNGEGKTTLLEGLLLALYGARSSMAPAGRTSYSSYLQSLIHRNADESASCGVELLLELQLDAGSSELRIRRSWHGRQSSGPQESVEVWRDDELDPILTGRLPEFVEGVIPRGVAPLFFFDGERIEELAEVENAARAIRAALDALLGLELVEQLTQDLLTVERRQAEATTSGEESDTLDAVETEIQTLYAKVEAEQLARGEAKSELDHARGQLERVDDEFRRAGGAAHLERSSREAETFAARAAAERGRERLRELARGSAPLLMLKDELAGIVKAQSTRDNYDESVRFANAVEKRDAQIVEWMRERERVDLAEDLAQFLESDRRERHAAPAPRDLPVLARNITGLRTLVEDRLPGIESMLTDGLSTIAASRERVDEAERRLSEIPPEQKIAAFLERLNAAKVRVEEAEFGFQRAERQLASSRAECDRAVSRRAKILRQVAESRGEADRHARIMAYASRARATLSELKRSATERNLARIETMVLDSLRVLLRKHNLIHRVKIDPESSRLTLFTDGDRIIEAGELSAGERQLVALSLLWGLARSSEGALPVVIDTPLGRLDSEHRELFAKHYLPHAASQVIVLSTDTEIDEELVSLLGKSVSHTLRLRHADGTQATQVESGYFDGVKVAA